MDELCQGAYPRMVCCRIHHRIRNHVYGSAVDREIKRFVKNENDSINTRILCNRK